jgi:hypothetical protein
MGQLSEQLASIGLRYTAAQLDDTMALATRKRWTRIQLLECLVSAWVPARRGSRWSEE